MGEKQFLTRYCSNEALNGWLKYNIGIQTFVRTASSSLTPHLNNIFIFNRAAAEGQHEQINFKPIFNLNFLWFFLHLWHSFLIFMTIHSVIRKWAAYRSADSQPRFRFLRPNENLVSHSGNLSIKSINTILL